MSLPTELEALAFFIILLMSLIVGSGSVNLVFFLGIKYCSICKGVMLLFVVNFDLMLCILSVKWLFAMLVICFSLVITLFLYVISLGGDCFLCICHIFDSLPHLFVIVYVVIVKVIVSEVIVTVSVVVSVIVNVVVYI